MNGLKSIKETLDILDISRATCYRYMKKGILWAIKKEVPNKCPMVFFTTSDVERVSVKLTAIRLYRRTGRGIMGKLYRETVLDERE